MLSLQPSFLLFILMFLYIIQQITGTFSYNSTSLLGSLHGQCKKIWRKEPLLGKCFGLSPYKSFIKKNFPDEKVMQLPDMVTSPSQCRSLCCNLGPKCVTWQYQDGRSHPCKIGGPVRVGNEGGPSSNWCEPLPPALWSGYRLKRIKTTSDKNGVSNENCQDMRGEDVPYQCFGLGGERKHSLTHKQLTVDECEAACCADPKCEIWQSIAGRGCFYNRNEGIYCGDKSEQPYVGGRKCVEGFCGSRENEKMMLKRLNSSS